MGVEYTLLFRRLADGNQSIVHKVILNWLIKTDGVTVTDGRDINASTLELVDECLIMISTHGRPPRVLDFVIKRGY